MSNARYIYAEPAREVLALFLNNVRLPVHFARSRGQHIRPKTKQESHSSKLPRRLLSHLHHFTNPMHHYSPRRC